MEITLPDAEVSISTELERMMHKTIRKVTEDVGRLRMNTAIAALIECKNEFAHQEKLPKSYLKNLVLLTSPFAPHLGEENDVYSRTRRAFSPKISSPLQLAHLRS